MITDQAYEIIHDVFHDMKKKFMEENQHVKQIELVRITEREDGISFVIYVDDESLVDEFVTTLANTAVNEIEEKQIKLRIDD